MFRSLASQQWTADNQSQSADRPPFPCLSARFVYNLSARRSSPPLPLSLSSLRLQIMRFSFPPERTVQSFLTISSAVNGSISLLIFLLLLADFFKTVFLFMFISPSKILHCLFFSYNNCINTFKLLTRCRNLTSTCYFRKRIAENCLLYTFVIVPFERVRS